MLADCFLATLKTYPKLRDVQLAAAAGVTRGVLSQLRAGGDCKLSTLDKLLEGLEALHPGARLRFCQLLASGASAEPPEPEPKPDPKLKLDNLIDLIESLHPEELGYLFYVLGDRFAQRSTGKKFVKRQHSEQLPLKIEA